jgi:hypothetical protein
MIAIAATTATVTAFAAAIISFFVGLVAGSHKAHKPQMPELHDTEARIRDLTEKVRQPWKHRAKRIVRW